ncbi:uncharacterized protein [Macaca fascicularis]|uniref:uncharacterized protein n=1 Tax=Macaca fascicularis TaxID=9541 RepID=UPI003D15B2E3
MVHHRVVGETAYQTHFALRAPPRAPACAQPRRALGPGPCLGARRPPPPPTPQPPGARARPAAAEGAAAARAPSPRLASRARFSSAAAAGSPWGAASWSWHRAPLAAAAAGSRLAPRPVLRLLLPGLLRGGRILSCSYKGEAAARSLGNPSPGRGPGTEANPESRGESEPRLEEPVQLCREAAGSTAYCKTTSVRPSPSRFSPPPTSPIWVLGRLLF